MEEAFLSSRKMLITGGCGFIGTNLIRRIEERRGSGTQVMVLDDESMGTSDDLPAQVRFSRGDVRDFSAVARAVSGCDTVVHLAAATGVVDSIANPALSFDINARGSFNVLLAARDAGVKRVVLASTGGAILGDVPPPVHEGMVPNPQSPYGASKLAAEGYAHAFAGSYGLRVTALRFSNVYGPRSHRKGSAVAHFFRQIRARQPITVYGDGSQVRDFVFVDDVCDGILQAIDSDVTGVFQLGSGIPTSISALLEEMRRVVGPEWPIEVHNAPRRAGEVMKTYCDISNARRAFGFKPRVALESGLPTTWSWLLDHRSAS
ncbi:MAG: NAD-dependent epimerase/dehydratase family protein [Enhydrobacter sp.]|nr:NAD-dependent epimerase/dehydratase family protein [Enhydrobacter sp.]